MNSTRWIVSGIFCLLFSGLLTLPFARADVEAGHTQSLPPVRITFESGIASVRQSFSRLPLVKGADPTQELDRIALFHLGGDHSCRLLVAMRLGNRLNLLSDTVHPFKGFPYARRFDQEISDQLPGRVLRFHRDVRMVDSSGVFSEDEKVIEEPDEWDEDVVDASIADPLEPLNRVFFHFNDKLYFWVLKPVAKGYRYVVPEPLRVSVRNVFTNLATPIRAVNCLLQGKFRGFGREVLRFFVNSTAGMLGLADVATSGMHLEGQDEDFGQTLGFFGAGPGLFINWPILGPSTARDTVGMVGDWFADPVNYLAPKRWENIAVKGGDKINRTSLSLGDYESLKKSALDPYVALRDAYFQYRKNKINK